MFSIGYPISRNNFLALVTIKSCAHITAILPVLKGDNEPKILSFLAKSRPYKSSSVTLVV